MANWDTVYLGDICEIERGGSPRPINEFITTAEGGVNWVKITDATASGKCIYATEEKIIPEGVKRSRMVHPGDFILSNSMSFGRPYIMQTTGCIHDGWLALRKPNADTDFLYFILSSEVVANQFESLAAGSAVRNLNVQIAKKIKIPLPPLAEQRKIAAILRTWDEAIETAEAEIKAKQERKRGLMRHLLTPGAEGSGVASVAILRRKMPKGWKMGCLGDLAKGARGVSFSPEKLLQAESAESVILLRSNNIKDGKLNYDEVYFLPMDQVQASQIASQGDLAVCMSNGSKRLVGKAARISNEDAEKKICVGAFCSLFKPTDQAHTEVIPYLFDSDLYKRELYIILAGSAINNLKNSDIEQVPTLIPPIDAQRKIAEILMITDGDIDIINHRIEAMRTQKRGLMQKLLTGEVRVAA